MVLVLCRPGLERQHVLLGDVGVRRRQVVLADLARLANLARLIGLCREFGDRGFDVI